MATENTKDALAKDQIADHEGICTDVYLDSLGNPTGGIGHHFAVGSRIPLEVVEILFEYDYREAVGNLDTYRFKGLNVARHVALVDMMFNLGPNRFAGFKKMIAAIREDDWERAADEAENSKWYGQVGRRGKKIVRQLRTGVL